jgi:hypothetical protein
MTDRRHSVINILNQIDFFVLRRRSDSASAARATVGASVKAGATEPQAAICGGVSPANQSESAESIEALCRCAARATARRPDNKKGAAEAAPFTDF